MPSILSGALLIMLYSMAHFGTVAVLGVENGIFNIPTLIYERIHQSAGSFEAIRTGTVLATVLVFTAALIIWLQNKILNKGRFQIIAGKSFRPIEVKLRGLRKSVACYLLTLHRLYNRIAYSHDFPCGGLKNLWITNYMGNLTLE